MNYSESLPILEEIKKASKILINCHRSPDSDSVGSALGLSRALEIMGKDVLVICPSDIPPDLQFLSGSNEIAKRVDFSNFNFSDYDLFITLDSSSYGMVSGSNEIEKTKDVPIVVIDHHPSNTGYGIINLIDEKMTSTGELLFRLFEDWEVSPDQITANCLLTGIIGDTGCFMYQNVGEDTLKIAARLISLGADKDNIVYNIYRNINFSELKVWGKIIENMQMDKVNRFVWSTLSVTDCKDYVNLENVKEDAANLFFSIVRDTDFGIIMQEMEGGELSVSLRSRSDFDVSQIAKELGGGGHKAASGVRIENIPFDEAVEKVLSVARKYAKKD